MRAVPTLLFFNQGNLEDRIVGLTTVNAVRLSIERLMEITVGILQSTSQQHRPCGIEASSLSTPELRG